MNELQIFKYNQNEIRTVEKDGEPWWVAKDVCEVFGETNYRRSVKSIDEDEKGVSQMNTPGGNQNMVIVNEAGLYSLLFAMQPKKARGVSEEHIAERQECLKNFKRWVTHEVLPSIRKHGAYAVDQLLDNPDLAIKAFTALKEERDARKKLETENALQRQIIGELQPKANYVDRILNSKSLVNITQIAKDYGMSGRAMNKILHDLHVQFKQGGQWLLYSQHQSMGYTHSQTIEIQHNSGLSDTKMETKWTQKGRLFLYELLKSAGILPVIERDSQKTA